MRPEKKLQSGLEFTRISIIHVIYIIHPPTCMSCSYIQICLMYLYPPESPIKKPCFTPNLWCQDAIKTLGATQIDSLSFRAGYGLVGVTCWNQETTLGCLDVFANREQRIKSPIQDRDGWIWLVKWQVWLVIHRKVETCAYQSPLVSLVGFSCNQELNV